MFLGNKRYNAIGPYLKNKFGEKVIKLSLDGGFTCPNRDGTLSDKGCIFCSDRGSGEFSSPKELSIMDQMQLQIEKLRPKWPHGKYIAYFQNYTNTYGDISTLRKMYNESLNMTDVVGLAIATRPDCISDDTLELLNEFNKKTFLWVELGLQTMHEKTALYINRQYTLETFEYTLKRLNKYAIKTVVHLIFGLPFETKNDILNTVKYISSKNLFGVKFHLLYVLMNTPLADIYRTGVFDTLDKNDYIQMVVDALEYLPPHVTVHRLTGDAPWKTLISPKWSTDKRGVLNSIDAELKRRNTWQGKLYVNQLTK